MWILVCITDSIYKLQIATVFLIFIHSNNEVNFEEVILRSYLAYKESLYQITFRVDYENGEKMFKLKHILIEIHWFTSMKILPQ